MAQPGAQAAGGPQKRRSYKEQRELELLPATIEVLEQEIAALHCRIASADFYTQLAAEIGATQRLLKDRETRLATAFQRWQELDLPPFAGE